MLIFLTRIADCEIGSPFFTLKSITIFKIQPIAFLCTFVASCAYAGRSRVKAHLR